MSDSGCSLHRGRSLDSMLAEAEGAGTRERAQSTPVSPGEVHMAEGRRRSSMLAGLRRRSSTLSDWSFVRRGSADVLTAKEAAKWEAKETAFGSLHEFWESHASP